MSVSSPNTGQVIVVTGDVTMDWNIASTRHVAEGTASWAGELDRTHADWQRGGAALLADLIEAIAHRLREQGGPHYQVRQTGAPKEPVVPGDPRFHHTYSLWTRFPHSARTTSLQRSVWRMAAWLGLHPSTDDDKQAVWAKVVDDAPNAALVVLDDADLGFRHQPAWWPQALHSDHRPWVVLKMSRSVAQGPLWEHLHGSHADRLVVVTTIDDLRQMEVQISRELSWERTAQDLTWEMLYNPRINALCHSAHVVVTFGASGAMLFSRQPSIEGSMGRAFFQSRLVFDPQVIEGVWEEANPGSMIGYTSCLAAALSYHVLANPDHPDIVQAVQSGLAASRRLHKEGYGHPDSRSGTADEVVFPTGLVVDELISEPIYFAVAPVRDPGHNLVQPVSAMLTRSQTGLWTILEDRYAGGLNQVAQQIVLQGVERALEGVPLGQFGSLLTVDRQEIESFRSLRALVGEYSRQTNLRRPLSIAVFGAPGSGKSFAVTQVASSLLPGQIEKLEFNLSQFASSHQLLDAFHRVRDAALSGRIPLVFWDEFDTSLDSQPLGWLRHFLAPMQDGAFQEGQIVHPLGRAIFVFAGGTSESMTAFDRGAGDPAFRAAKGPDFVSRLRGYVDIVGPNPRGGDPNVDRYYIIRRAILLRLLLQSNAPQLFQRREGALVPQIDSGLLRAFLEIPAYRHGARSLEAVITTSTLAGKTRFERSSLPTEPQLNLHVDGHQFLSLVQRLELTGALVERLAEAAHEIYQSIPAHDRETETPVQAYRELSESEKEQNRALVQDIPTKLAYAGYVMQPARSDEQPFDFPGDDRELLAEEEHNRWLKARVAAGWRHGPVTDTARKIHAAMLPWRVMTAQERSLHFTPAEEEAIGPTELPDREKEKDRLLIDGIPLILAKAGFTLIKVREHVGDR